MSWSANVRDILREGHLPLSVQAGARLVSRSPTPRTEPLSAIFYLYARSRSLATHYSMGLSYADGLELFFRFHNMARG